MAGLDGATQDPGFHREPQSENRCRRGQSVDVSREPGMTLSRFEPTADDLADRVLDGEVVFFIGSGFSLDSEETAPAGSLAASWLRCSRWAPSRPSAAAETRVPARPRCSTV